MYTHIHTYTYNSIPSKTSVITAIIYWRPTDLISLRAVNILENLQRKYPLFFNVVSIVSPKYPSEGFYGSSSGGDSSIDSNGDNSGSSSNNGNSNNNNDKEENILTSLLLPSEQPTNILIDSKLESYRQATLSTWPTVFLCVKKGITVGEGNNDKNSGKNSGNNGGNNSGNNGDKSSSSKGGDRGKIVFAMESQSVVSSVGK